MVNFVSKASMYTAVAVHKMEVVFTAVSPVSQWRGWIWLGRGCGYPIGKGLTGRFLTKNKQRICSHRKNSHKSLHPRTATGYTREILSQSVFCRSTKSANTFTCPHLIWLFLIFIKSDYLLKLWPCIPPPVVNLFLRWLYMFLFDFSCRGCDWLKQVFWSSIAQGSF